VPADPLSQGSADQRREEGAHVDPHVEDRKTRIAPIVVCGIQLADDRADVGFEKAVPSTINTSPA